MSYSFNPMTEEELNSASMIEEGFYDFEVVKSTRKTSKSGNPMAELNINVWDKEGKQHLIFDYLVFSTVPLNIKKVKHFCDAVGLQDQYKQGQIPEELERYCGKVLIGIQEEKPNPNGGCWPKKNIVVDYLKSDKESSKKPIESNELNDDIPF